MLSTLLFPIFSISEVFMIILLAKKYDADENTWKHVVFLQNVKKLL